MKYNPADLSKIKTVEIGQRESCVSCDDFSKPLDTGSTFSQFIDSLPNILAAKDLIEIADLIAKAKEIGKPVVMGIGAHVIKCGLSPVLIDLMEKGIVTSLVMNGACVIHDVELAFFGETSEDVQAAIKDGSFGMSKQTGELVNETVSKGIRGGLGFGRAVGQKILSEGTRPELSILAAAAKLDLPATVHVAFGTDIVHMHPNFDPCATGEATHLDFRLLCSVVADLSGGGVYLNVGSAVVLPEVFLKAITVARNFGNEVENFSTVNIDFIQHYRPRQNVVLRPTSGEKSKGFSLTGHHEIMIPLLAAAVKEKLEGKR